MLLVSLVSGWCVEPEAAVAGVCLLLERDALGITEEFVETKQTLEGEFVGALNLRARLINSIRVALKYSHINIRVN
jgi:hypothetical protein